MTELGRSTHIVEIQIPGPPAADGQGGFTETWQTVAPRWYCSIASAAGQNLEREIGTTIEASATHLLAGGVHAGLADPKVSALARVHVLDGPYVDRLFAVRSVQLSERPPYQHLVVCSEVLADPELQNDRRRLGAAEASP